MKCPKCKKEVVDDSEFCRFCGTEIIKKKVELIKKESVEIKESCFNYKRFFVSIFIMGLLFVIGFSVYQGLDFS